MNSLGYYTRATWFWALLTFLLVISWQTLTVHTNYAGNWTGLFRTGKDRPVPDRLAARTLRNPHPAGYDGQFYRYLAHDPLLLRDAAAAIDAPRMRSQRILVSALAWVIGACQERFIDAAYILVIAGFIFLGAFFLSRIMLHYRRHPAWGMLFLAVPSALVAVDSMTVDVAVASLTAVFAWQWVTGRERWMWFTLAAACLVRDSGGLLLASAVLAALLARNYRRALLWSTAFLPTLAWYQYLKWALPVVGRRDRVVPLWIVPKVEFGALARALDPPAYPLLPADVAAFVRALDVAALLSILAAALLALFLAYRYRSPLRIALVLHAAFVFALTSKEFWTPSYGWVRPVAPLFVLLFAHDSPRRLWFVALAAAAFVDLRVLAEWKTQILGILNRIL